MDIKLKNTVERILVSDTPDEYVKASGIDLLGIYKELGDIALNAQLRAKNGLTHQWENVGRDCRSRLLAIGMILELKRHLKDKSVIAQVSIVNDPAVKAEVNRLKSLFKE